MSRLAKNLGQNYVALAAKRGPIERFTSTVYRYTKGIHSDFSATQRRSNESHIWRTVGSVYFGRRLVRHTYSLLDSHTSTDTTVRNV